jgi:hypothetical protein
MCRGFKAFAGPKAGTSRALPPRDGGDDVKLWLMGIGVLVMWLALAIGSLGVLAGVPLFTGRDRPHKEPVEVVLMAAPPGAIEVPVDR